MFRIVEQGRPNGNTRQQNIKHRKEKQILLCFNK
ncbi:unnamed protein product [Arabidopsis halleri]